jgi:medium-chain acyl-[acyl-carrier-protein] hydrolase
MNILQDVADENASMLGFGLDFCINSGLTWVGTNYILEIDRLPKIHETIKIVTWPSARNKFSAYRDFEVFGEDGQPIIRATSEWALISLARRRPVSVIDNLPIKEIVASRAIDAEFPKIPEVEEFENQYKFRVRFDDIDINKHINNAVYILWASESVDSAFRINNNPAKISINFKKEGFVGEKVMVITEQKGKSSLHSIRTYGDDERELARVQIDWR